MRRSSPKQSHYSEPAVLKYLPVGKSRPLLRLDCHLDPDSLELDEDLTVLGQFLVRDPNRLSFTLEQEGVGSYQVEWDPMTPGPLTTMEGYIAATADSRVRVVSAGVEWELVLTQVEMRVELDSPTGRAALDSIEASHIQKAASAHLEPSIRSLLGANRDLSWNNRPLRLDGHRSAISAPTVVPSLRKLVGYGGWTVGVWDLGPATVGPPLQLVHTNRITSIAVSEIDGIVFAGDSKGRLTRWCLRTGARLGRQLTAHEGPISSIGVSMDGQILTSWSIHDLTLHRWSAQNDLRWLSSRSIPLGRDDLFELSADGQVLFTWSPAGSLNRWEGSSTTVVRRQISDLHNLTFNHDATRFLAHSDEGLCEWDAISGYRIRVVLSALDLGWREEANIEGDSCWALSRGSHGWQAYDPVTARQLGQEVILKGKHGLAIDAEREQFICTHYDGSITRWNYQTGQPMGELPNPLTGGRVVDFQFSPDGRSLVTAGADRLIKLWDAATGQELLSSTEPLLGRPLAVGFDASGDAVVVTESTGGLARLSLSNEFEPKYLGQSPRSAWDARFDRASNSFTVWGLRKFCKLHVRDPGVPNFEEGVSGPALGAAYATDIHGRIETFLCDTDQSGLAVIMQRPTSMVGVDTDQSDLTETNRTWLTTNWVSELSVSEIGEVLIANEFGPLVLLRSPDERQQVGRKLETIRDRCTTGAFSADSSAILVATEEGEIHVLDSQSGVAMQKISEPGLGLIKKLKMDLHRARIAAAGLSGMCLWRPSHARLQLERESLIRSEAFANDEGG